MRRKTMDILLGFVISILMALSVTQEVLAQCNWSTKVRIEGEPLIGQAQPGLTASGDRLILTWSAASSDSTRNKKFTSAISFDGVNWSNLVRRTDFPIVAQGVNGGLGMTYSPTCGAVYAAWRDDNNNMFATKSADGINWDAARFIVGALSAPALRGDDGSLPIGFAFSTIHHIDSRRFEAIKGKFNCDFSNPVFLNPGCFFTPWCNQFTIQTGAWSPVWTGAGVTTELSAIATGAPNQGGGVGPAVITHQVNNDFPQNLPDGFWSNNGLAGTVNPNDGTPYLAWTCHEDFGDTCSPKETGKINILNVRTRAHLICSDWSDVNPAITFFQGKIWVAWRARRSGIFPLYSATIASLNPF